MRYVELTVGIITPEIDRDKQLQLHILENYRDNWTDEDIFKERVFTSGFGPLEYDRMIETLTDGDTLTSGGFLTLRKRIITDASYRTILSPLGQAYLKFLQEQGVSGTTVSVILPQSPPVPMADSATPKPWWHRFWRKDALIIAGLVSAAALAIGVAIQCGAV